MPTLDGLRGLAVLMVIMVHWDPFVPQSFQDEMTFHWWDLRYRWPRIGWLGVDLFFVLSGFLITGILLRQRGSTAPLRAWGTFMARRALRILPLYYTLLFVMIVLVPLSGWFVAWKDFWISRGMGTYPWWLFFNNVTNALGYGRHRLMDVAWSLCVEEQFYLLWPLFVLRYSPAVVQRICIGLMIGSPLLRALLCFGLGSSASLVSYLGPCRLDGLAAGGFLACAMHRSQTAYLLRIAHTSRWLVIGCPAILLGLLAYQESHAFVDGMYVGVDAWLMCFGLSISSLTFAAMLLCALVPYIRANELDQKTASVSDGMNHYRSLLSWSPLRAIGKVSFGLYLLHQPAHWLATQGTSALAHRLWGKHVPLGGLSDKAWSFLFGTAIVALLATASWHFLEKPFQNLKRFFPYEDSHGSADRRQTTTT